MVDDPGHSRPSAVASRTFGRWVTLVQIGLLVVALALSAYVASRPSSPDLCLCCGRPLGAADSPAAACGMRGMPQLDRKIVKDFDKNGDKRLDAAERAAAREWLRKRSNGGGGGFGRRGGGANGRRPSPACADVRPTCARIRARRSTTSARCGRCSSLSRTRTGTRSSAAFYGTDVEVPATVVVDGKTYRDVGVHFRGKSSYRMVPEGSSTR